MTSAPTLPAQPTALPSARPAPPDAAACPVVHSQTIRVYYEDTDAGGIVYYANWLRFFERARTDWLRALGVEHTRVAQEDGVVFVVREAAIDYRRPARLDDEVVVDVRVLEARRASLTLLQAAALKGSAEPLVVATVKVAAIDRDSGRPAGIPRWLSERIAR